MTELKKLIEAANAVDRCWRHQLLRTENALEAFKQLHCAIPAAEAELAGMGERIWAEGFAAGFDCSDTGSHSNSYPNPYAPPSEPEENEDGDTRQPIGNCPTCGIPIYTDEGFCGVCGRR